MGRLVSQDIDNLVGGVSQQSPTMRLPTQCEKQVNCWNSLVSGMSPRPTTKRIGEIDLSDSTAFSIDYRRDEREFYKVTIADDGKEILKVFDARTGVKFPIEFGPELVEEISIRDNPDGTQFQDVPYLRVQGDKTYRESFDALPIGDSFLILNKTFPVKRTFGGSAGNEDPATVDQVRYMMNVRTIPLSSLGSYYASNPSHENNAGEEAGYIYYINGQRYRYSIHDKAEDVANKLAHDIKSDNPGYEVDVIYSTIYVTVPGGAPAMSFTDRTKAAYIYKYQAIRYVDTEPGEAQRPAEVTLSKSDITRVNTVTLRSETITTALSDTGRPDHEAIVWVKQADYATEYRVFVNGDEASYKTVEATSDRARDGLRTEHIAQNLANGLNDISGVVCHTYGNTLHLIMDGNYELDVTDSLGDSALISFKRDISSESDLPGTYVPNGYLVRVRGDLTDSLTNGYWLRYNSDENIWKEGVGLEANEGFDLTTMPLLLNRRQNFDYITDENPYGIYFDLTVADWKPRQVGDEESAPFPSFVSKQDTETGAIVTPNNITAMVVHHNRLLLISRDTIIASEIGKFFNLFPTTTATTVDSDPFEVNVDTNSTLDIRFVQPMASALMLWDSREQHVLMSDSVFTSETIFSRRVASKDIDITVKPLAIGNRGMFLTKRGKYYGCHEIFAEDGIEVFNTADVSSQIPEYLNGTITKMVSSTENNLVLCLSTHISEANADTDSNSVYVYNYFDSGNERVQSAWSEWTFNGEVLDISVDGTEILLTVRRMVEPAKTVDEDGVEEPAVYKTYMEVIQLAYDETEQTHGHPVYIDSYVTSESEPTDLNYKEIKKKIDGIWYRGYPLNAIYEFSPFYVRDNNNTAVSGGRLQLKRLLISYYDTTNFVFEVETLARETRTRLFQGRVLGRLDNLIGKVPVTSGTYSAPIMGRSGAVKVRIRNNEVFGFKFQSATWEGFYNKRSRGM